MEMEDLKVKEPAKELLLARGSHGNDLQGNFNLYTPLERKKACRLLSDLQSQTVIPGTRSHPAQWCRGQLWRKYKRPKHTWTDTWRHWEWKCAYQTGKGQSPELASAEKNEWLPHHPKDYKMMWPFEAIQENAPYRKWTRPVTPWQSFLGMYPKGAWRCWWRANLYGSTVFNCETPEMN